MSQIGYMIMGVSAGAYVAGMFHLMTHAFFKALLFMAAGSLISAMGGEQNMDKMGGFRKAMPFTFLAFVIGGLALSGIPPFSGFFSKDEILASVADQGGWHWILWAAGIFGAFLTAVYTWRMIFRAFWGRRSPRRRSSRRAPAPPARAPQPGDGRARGHRRRLPGPEHHIAERATPMRLAMGTLAVLAVLGGLLGIPHVFTPLEHFLEPVFEDTMGHHEIDGTITVVGLIVGALAGILGIAVAWRVWGKPADRGEPTAISAGFQQRFAPIHRLFLNKWYFDELIDLVIVRPARAFGRWAADTFERLVISGGIVGGTTGAVCGPARWCAACSQATCGRTRPWSSPASPSWSSTSSPRAERGPMLHLSILLWLPVVFGLLGLLVPERTTR